MGCLFYKAKGSVYLVPVTSLGLGTIAGAQQIPSEDRSRETREQIGGNNDFFLPPGVEGCFQFKRSCKLPGSGVQEPRDADAALPWKATRHQVRMFRGLPWPRQGTCISWMLSSSLASTFFSTPSPRSKASSVVLSEVKPSFFRGSSTSGKTNTEGLVRHPEGLVSGSRRVIFGNMQSSWTGLKRPVPSPLDGHTREHRG